MIPKKNNCDFVQKLMEYMMNRNEIYVQSLSSIKKRIHLQFIIIAFLIVILGCVTEPLPFKVVKKDLVEGGKTKLMTAVEKSDIKTIQSLIAGGEDVNAKNELDNLMTPLHYACKKNDLKAVKILLANKAKPNVFTDYMLSPLHFAAQNGSSEIVSTLIDYGANPDLKEYLGKTPLHYAVMADQNPTAEILIRKGASFAPVEKNETDLNLTGDTALLYAQTIEKKEEARKYFKIAADYYEKASMEYNEIASSASSRIFWTKVSYYTLIALNAYGGAYVDRMQAKQYAQISSFRDADKFGGGMNGLYAAYQANYKSYYDTAATSSTFPTDVKAAENNIFDTTHLEVLKEKYISMSDNCKKLSEECLKRYNKLETPGTAH